MHLLVTQSGTIDDGSEPRDLGQTPGDIVVLSSADSELALLADAHRQLTASAPQPALRLANLMQLKHHFSVDLYAEKTLSGARIVVLRLLGGRSYWAYGLERLLELAEAGAFRLVVLPGDDQPDPQLEGLSSVDDETREMLWAFLREGGPDNARGFLEALAALLGAKDPPLSARPLLKAGVYRAGSANVDGAAPPHPPAYGGSPRVKPGAGPLPPGERADLPQSQCLALSLDGRGRREAPGEGEKGKAHSELVDWRGSQPSAALIFYRALVQSGDLAAVDALIEALARRGLDVLPIYVNSLRDPFARETIRAAFERAPPDIILNATAFAATLKGGGAAKSSPFDGLDAIVLQVVFSGESEARWASGTRGLSPHYIAMHVALPEVDGRLLTRAVSFKSDSGFDEATQYYLTRAEPNAGRVDFVADLAAAWVRLRRTPAPERKLALILANYPNKDARLANGVGLDTPQSAIDILRALGGEGYKVGEIPENGNALIAALREGPTNAALNGRQIEEYLPLETYLQRFDALPDAVRSQVTERWGPPAGDPFFTGGGFAIPALRFGNVVAGIQPARGYNIDPKGSYHDPALVPPHGYIAFYIWLRDVAGMHAAVHLGKHGNLEWLPGKALALSEDCFPEAVLGPVPNIYPFIVNDPGEGAQAKRRTAAILIDHYSGGSISPASATCCPIPR
jgi:cobaltochelatase CobN